VKNRRKNILLVLVLMLVGVLTVTGCTAAGQQIAQGWAGGVVSGDTLFVGSMEGQLVAMDITDGSFRGDPITLIAQAQSGGLGCVPAAGSSAVAVYGSPVINEDLIYVGGYDGKVRAFLFEDERLRPEPRWISRQGDIGGNIIGGLAIADGRVYFGASDGWIYALDAVDGHKLWEHETEGKVWSSPAVENGTVYIGSFDRKLYALNAGDGSEKWVFETEGTIVSTPAIANGKVYISSFDRHVYAIDAASGEEVWRFPATEDSADAPTGWFWASPVLHNGAVYAPNLDGRVYVLDTASGNRISDFNLEGPVSSSPVVVNDLIIVATTSTNRAKQKSKIFSLDTTDGQKSLLKDIEESVHAPLFSDGTSVYVHTMKNSLYIIDAETGAGKKFTLSPETGE